MRPTRWRIVAEAWLAADRFFARSAEAGGHPLGQEAYAPSAAGLRMTALRLVARRSRGTVLDLDQLAEAAAWHRPSLRQGPLTARSWCSGRGVRRRGWGWRHSNAVSSFARVLCGRVSQCRLN